jgi:hypothetical protein
VSGFEPEFLPYSEPNLNKGSVLPLNYTATHTPYEMQTEDKKVSPGCANLRKRGGYAPDGRNGDGGRASGHLMVDCGAFYKGLTTKSVLRISVM